MNIFRSGRNRRGSLSKSSFRHRGEHLCTRPRRLALESLENRLLLSTVFTVTNTSDSGTGSLREAILDANSTSGADSIAFNIPGSGPHTIQPLSRLPQITDPVVIDGYTQPGASPNTNPTGSGLNTVLKIELDGSLAGAAHGLSITAGNSTVRGVAIHSFKQIGVVVFGDSNFVQGNLIGTDVTGTAPLGNSRGVKVLAGAQFNVIGTNGDGVADEAERNLISGNRGNGVSISGGNTNHNTVAGNFIGTDVSGTVALGNGTHGGHGVFLLWGAKHNVIGTDGDGIADAIERNVISGNDNLGVAISRPGTDHNTVAGNFIGVDVTGVAPLGNDRDGVYILLGAQLNRIGTDGDGVGDEAERNIISGNSGNGVSIENTGTDNNVVAGNFIGTDVTGTAALGNGNYGVYITGGSQSNWIGSNGDGWTDDAERNVISGNTLHGVFIDGEGSNANVVAGNFIGTDVTGAVALGNSRNGVLIRDGARSNRIGTNGDGVADTVERNIISGNGNTGVILWDPGTDENVVAGNFIGTDVTGKIALGNGDRGVMITHGVKFTRVGTNGDGVADDLERNIVSGNASIGVSIASIGSDENVVAGNYIGVDVTGTSALGNGGNGVHVYVSAQSNLIGTDGDGLADAAERNIISGNGGNGVYIGNAGTDDNVVAGNYIGTDVSGTAALGNGYYGVWILAGAQANRIDRNIISANVRSGIAIKNSGSDYNVVSGNFLGTDAAGIIALPNGENGVIVYAGAKNNRIGTNGDGVADEAERNVISGNTLAGVTVIDDTSTGNRIQANSIHSNGGLGIDLGGDRVTPNDLGDTDTGANDLQNYPVISLARPGTTTRVAGDFNSTPNTTFTLDFYASSDADPSGFGEGERWLDSAVVTTDAAGNVSFDVVLAAATISGEVVTATATDPEGNTSEFSNSNVLARVPVQIDVKPGSDSNPVNLASQGVIAVAILTTDVFDASLVDASTVLFAEAQAVHSAMEDVDGDGDLDLVLHFRTEDTILGEIYADLLADDSNEDGILDSNHQQFAASLTGKTTNDEYFEGFDELDLFLSGTKLRDLLDDLAAVGLI